MSGGTTSLLPPGRPAATITGKARQGDSGELLAEAQRIVRRLVSTRFRFPADPACDREDLVQVGLLAIVRRLPRWDASRYSWAVFAFVVARSAILDELRKQRVRLHALTEGWDIRDDFDEVAAVDDREEARAMWRAIEPALAGADHRLIGTIARHETQAAVAAELGISEATVSRRRKAVASQASRVLHHAG